MTLEAWLMMVIFRASMAERMVVEVPPSQSVSGECGEPCVRGMIRENAERDWLRAVGRWPEQV